MNIKLMKIASHKYKNAVQNTQRMYAKMCNKFNCKFMKEFI